MRKLLVVGSLGLAAAAPASAQAGANYSAITEAVDFTTAIAAMMAIGAVVALPKIARAGIRFVLKLIPG